MSRRSALINNEESLIEPKVVKQYILQIEGSDKYIWQDTMVLDEFFLTDFFNATRFYSKKKAKEVLNSWWAADYELMDSDGKWVKLKTIKFIIREIKIVVTLK